MQSVPSLLRDPIWQSIGAALSLAALVVALLTIPGGRKEVSIVHIETAALDAVAPLGLPDAIRRGIRNPDRVVVQTFQLFNNAPQALLPSDISEPLTVSPLVGVNLLNVDACSGFVTIGSAQPASIPLVWAKTGTVYAASARLLNAGETSCIRVLAERLDAAGDTPLVSFDLRVANYDVKGYRSLPEFLSTGLSGQWKDLLGLKVELRGVAVLLFSVAQTILFFVTASATLVAMRGLKNSLLVLALTVGAYLSTANASLVALLYSTPEPIVPVGWFLAVLHVIFLSLLARRALRNAVSIKKP
jgi:hypothetical protein